ncbi:hypothetical protein [Streptomyces sp. 6N223]|uniref:hypothetical protein n=1 Tax=Streptomyces sp. 6N223 TaxID=3457412 RepID=UPI003FD51463
MAAAAQGGQGRQGKRSEVVGALMERYGERSFAEEAEIHLGKTTPHALFQMFQLAALTDARVDPGTAVRAFVDLRGRRWGTAGQVREAGAEQVARVLEEAGYPANDSERIATAMTDAAMHLLEDHGGDLNELRDDADHDPRRERELLRHFAGVGDGTVDAFCREAQLLWEELRPFADKKALDAAARLDLERDAAGLRSLVRDDREFVRLVDALVRVRHDKEGYRELREMAA